MTGKIVAWTAGVLITALYVYTVVAAVGNVILLPQMAATLGVGLTPIGWGWLVFGVALPVVVYGLALLVARRRTAGPRILVLAAGLCLVAAVQLEVLHMVPQTSYFAV